MHRVNGTSKVILNIVTVSSEYSGLTRVALGANLKNITVIEKGKTPWVSLEPRQVLRYSGNQGSEAIST